MDSSITSDYGVQVGSRGGQIREYLLRDARILKAFAFIGLPLIFAMVMEGSNMMVDRFYLGKLGTVEIAASSLFAIPFVLGFGLMSTFMYGSSAYFTYILGVDKARASAVRLSGLTLLVSVGILYSLLVFISFDLWISIYSPEAALYDAARSYVYTMLVGLPVIYLFVGMSMFVKGEGAAIVVMFALIASVVLNIIFTPIMMFSFDWGIVGAALGTVLANTIAVLGMITFYMLGKSMVQLRSSFALDRKFAKKFAKESLRRGFPESYAGMLESVAMGIGLIFAAIYGDALVASYGLFLSIIILPMFIMWGFIHSARVLLNYNIGVGNVDRVKLIVRYATGITGLIGLSIFTMFMVFPYQIVEIFIKDAEVVEFVARALRFTAPMFLFIGFIDLYINYLVALGRGVLGGSIQMIKIVVQVPLLFLAYNHDSPMGIILSVPLSEAAFIILGILLMLSEKTFLYRLLGKEVAIK